MNLVRNLLVVLFAVAIVALSSTDASAGIFGRRGGMMDCNRAPTTQAARAEDVKTSCNGNVCERITLVAPEAVIDNLVNATPSRVSIDWVALEAAGHRGQPPRDLIASK